MAYVLKLGSRYLRSKKRSTISVITVIAVTGVALGVAALLAVMAITAGFQDEFRNKVLGVNAHVLVMKYGLDFDEYRDVVTRARHMPQVAGAAPFVINEMMISKGDRLQGVLVKGIDPALMPTVLDLPEHIIDGSILGLRLPGAAPPTRPDDLEEPFQEDEELDHFLEGLAHSDGGAPAAGHHEDDGDLDGGAPELTVDAGVRARRPRRADGGVAAAAPRSGPDAGADEEVVDRLPDVEVPTPEEVEASLQANPPAALPSDELEEQLFAEYEHEQEHPEEGAALPGIVIGVTLARTIGLGVGDRVRLISPLAGLDTSLWRPAGSGATPRSRDFRVIGIFEAGFQEYDSRLVYVDLYEAEAFLEQGDTVTGVEIRLHDLERAPEIARKLERDLGGGPYHTMDWEELNHNLFTALEIQKIMLSLVIATIIFVAAFNVIATLIMIVLEKKREIAILKAMGATDSGVLGIFMVQGLVIGLIGTVIGLVLGGGVCLYLYKYEFKLDPKVYLIDHLPVRLSLVEVLWTIVIAVLICAAATLVPSWWAARLLPADGVRYE